jgi:hypothetical protein
MFVHQKMLAVCWRFQGPEGVINGILGTSGGKTSATNGDEPSKPWAIVLHGSEDFPMKLAEGTDSLAK